MKIRQGFVSNSSSSSFVVAFEKKPKTKEKMQEMLFGTSTSIVCYDDIVTVDAAMSFLFRGFNFNKKNVKDTLMSGFSNTIFYALTYPAEQKSEHPDRKPYPGDYFHNRTNSELNWIKKTVKNNLPDINIDEIISSAQEKLLKLFTEKCGNESNISNMEAELIRRNNLVKPKYPEVKHDSPEFKKLYEEWNEKHTVYHKAVQKLRDDDVKINKLIEENIILCERIKEVEANIKDIIYEAYMKENEGKVLGAIEIHDDTSLGGTLEHGDTFKNVKHLRFSHH